MFTATIALSLLSGSVANIAQAESTTDRYAVGSYASVTETSKLRELDKYLVNSGYPQDVIATLDIEQKQRIYNEKAVFATYRKQVGNLNETSGSTPELHDVTGSEAIEPEQMNNFVQGLTASRVSRPSETGKIEFILDYNWTWTHAASFNLKDKFGISWTDDFDADPKSAVYAYRAYGISTLGGYGETTTGNVYTYEKYTPGNGIGWEYDILETWMTPAYMYSTYKHKGWGQVKISKWSNKSGLNEQTSAVATYFHKEGAFTGELSFNGGIPSIAISYAVNYDKADDTAANPFTWNHYKY